VRLVVKVTPGASRDAVVGWLGDAVKVAVREPAERGRANAAVERLLAVSLGVPAASVRIAAGGSSARKVVVVDGLEAGEVHRRLGRR
jgi:uncharacterized protein YggU (UPF0235/DUF167 family)